MTGVAASGGPGRPLRASDPTELGPYQLLRRLGEGGMGSVYLARRTERDPLVAVKMIRKDLSSDPDFRRRFRSEVARAQQVPAFCTAEVLDADPDHEPPYLVVEFVNGPSLAKVVQNQGPLSPANLHGLAIGMATALTAIHGAGIIHRDLKPANVLLAPGAPKVIDFGVARAAEGTGSDTAPHQLMGTIPYMAPERLDLEGRSPVTPAADIFAWGAVVAYAGTGRVPFGGGSAEAAARILTQPPDLTGLTGPLRDLVELALSKDPADRPAARDLLEWLVAGGPRQTRQGLIEAGSEQAVVSVPNVSEITRLIHPVSTDSDLPSMIEYALNEPTVPPRPRRRGRALLAFLSTAVVLLTATVAGMLTGFIGPFSGAASDPPTHTASSPSSSPAASPATTASVTVPPTGSVSPAPAIPVLPTTGEVELSNALVAVSPWFATRDELDTTCTFTSAGYRVRSTYYSTYRCHSNTNNLTDFVVEVDVTLRNAKTCGAFWFRVENWQGYLLSLCPDYFEVLDHHDVVQTRVWRWVPTKPIKVNETFRLGVVAKGSKIQIFQNGEFLFEAEDYTYSFGRIAMGIDEPMVKDDPDPREVVFKNIVVRKLSSSQP